ncbi:biotin attachment protein [Sphingomonas histidinilytica]|uniref:Biotin-requiring enzyme n=1 Tax=Rhizorhabdus histidinilytica TaxID=439228 RepID=A0A1T5H0W6_9SPHN|nr:lipoyl domain-containing protein [Rhizorhabdus histidinilytica]MBO9375841.1 biotin attachment protein [Rhizorhabdus histidinilytica]QEH81352.1 biotin attachment protein [Sphingomonas sp. C8-2]SKC14288.1 Biotin-requiring enzyme [Rhizorhabdus histidinilytica]
MANIKVLLPQFGMGMQEAEIVRWIKAVGDSVEAGEPLLEIEAAKTTVEVPSPGAGTLTEILAQEGDTVEVRAHIATIVA